MKYPKVGEQFYYKDCYGNLQERTCVYIEKREGVETMYFIQKDEHGGFFVSESGILDPDSEETKALIAKKEKEEWKKFWTDKHFKEMFDFLLEAYSCYCPPEYVFHSLRDFINLKTIC